MHAQPEIRTGAAQVWTGTQLPVGTGEVERARAAGQDPGPKRTTASIRQVVADLEESGPPLHTRRHRSNRVRSQVYLAGFLIGTGPPPGADFCAGGFLEPALSPISFTS